MLLNHYILPIIIQDSRLQHKTTLDYIIPQLFCCCQNQLTEINVGLCIRQLAKHSVLSTTSLLLAHSNNHWHSSKCPPIGFAKENKVGVLDGMKSICLNWFYGCIFSPSVVVDTSTAEQMNAWSHHHHSNNITIKLSFLILIWCLL